jgi:hypothetical protein
LKEEFTNNKENMKVNKENFFSKKRERLYKKDKIEISKKG